MLISPGMVGSGEPSHLMYLAHCKTHRQNRFLRTFHKTFSFANYSDSIIGKNEILFENGIVLSNKSTTCRCQRSAVAAFRKF